VREEETPIEVRARRLAENEALFITQAHCEGKA